MNLGKDGINSLYHSWTFNLKLYQKFKITINKDDWEMYIIYPCKVSEYIQNKRVF